MDAQATPGREPTEPGGWPFPFAEVGQPGFSRRHWLVLILAFAALHYGALGAAVWIGNFDPEPNHDHVHIMRQVLDGGLPRTAVWPPVYGYYLAFEHRLTEALGLPFWTAKLFVDVVPVVLSGVLSVLLAWRLTGNRLLAACSGVAMVGAPIFALASAEGLAVVLFQPLFLGALLALVRVVQVGGRPRTFAAAGALLGLACLVRANPQFLLVALAPAVWWGLRRAGRPHSVQAAALGLAVALAAQALLLLPWFLLQRRLGTSGVFAAPVVYYAFFDGIRRHDGFEVSEALRSDPDPPSLSAEGVVEFHREWLARDPVALVKLYVAKALRTWFLSDSGRWDRVIAAVHAPLWLLALAGLGLWLRRAPRDPALWLLVGTVLYMWAVSAAVSGLARYTAPVYGLLGLLAGAAWAALRHPAGRRLRLPVVALAGLAPLFGSCAPPLSPIPETPNVLLLVVDTLRADHLEPYDPSATFTPNVTRFAERGVVFRNAIAQAPNTIGSAPSILGSIYVSEHGYRNYGFAVSDEHLMLAEVLQEGGYETFGVAANPHVAARHGLAQGFDTFIDNPGWSDSAAHELDALFFDWLDRRAQPETPFFALLWYIEPHVPYDPPAEWLERHVAEGDRELVSDRTMWPARQPVTEAEQRVSRALYRAEVAYFDHQLGQLVAELDRRGLAEGSLIVLTADHGESFWERTDVQGRPIVGHGKSLFREELAVPLIVKLPGDRHAGTTVLGRADSIDIAPTVLEVVGHFPEEARVRFRGRSLLGGVGGPVGVRQDRPSFSELWTATDEGAVQSYMECVETGEGKLVRTHLLRKRRYQPPAAELLEPGSERPLAADADLAARLERDLRAWRSALQPLEPGPAELRGQRRELVRRLRALGYVD